MHPRKRLLPLALLALVAMLGCQSDDGVTDPAQSELGNASLVRGQIDGPADFEFLSEPATDDPDMRETLEAAVATFFVS